MTSDLRASVLKGRSSRFAAWQGRRGLPECSASLQLSHGAISIERPNKLREAIFQLFDHTLCPRGLLAPIAMTATNSVLHDRYHYSQAARPDRTFRHSFLHGEPRRCTLTQRCSHGYRKCNWRPAGPVSGCDSGHDAPLRCGIQLELRRSLQWPASRRHGSTGRFTGARDHDPYRTR